MYLAWNTKKYSHVNTNTNTKKDTQMQIIQTRKYKYKCILMHVSPRCLKKKHLLPCAVSQDCDPNLLIRNNM